MKRISVLLTILAFVGSAAFLLYISKLIKFSNITEATFGFQLGKTTKITSLPGGGEANVNVAGFKFPSPRISTSFGALFGDIFFLGPGLAYSYQPGDNNTTSIESLVEENQNPNQHKISVFGHARIHFSKGRFRPYTELKGGYTHIFSEEISSVYSDDTFIWDGVYAEPALGFALKLGAHGQLNTSLGYQFLNVWNRSEGFNNLSVFSPEMNDAYHRLLLSFGFSFY